MFFGSPYENEIFTKMVAVLLTIGIWAYVGLTVESLLLAGAISLFLGMAFPIVWIYIGAFWAPWLEFDPSEHPF